jgi:hypothetical protein
VFSSRAGEVNEPAAVADAVHDHGHSSRDLGGHFYLFPLFSFHYFPFLGLCYQTLVARCYADMYIIASIKIKMFV